MATDFYQILGVSKNASTDEIKKAYRKLAHLYHPDKSGGDEKKFKEINEAYQTLSDPQKRSQYDQFGQTFNQGQGFSGFGREQGFQSGNFDFGGINFDFGSFGGFGDIFESMFGGQSKSRREERRGSDLALDLEISFKEAAFGTTKKIEIKKQVLCENCKGSGAEPGSKFKSCPKCKGQGTIRNVRRTLLGSFMQETICPECEGEGKVPEKTCHKCHGKGINKETETIAVKIPAGIENGATLQLVGGGNTAEHKGKSGDLFVNIHIIPDPLFQRNGFDITSKLLITFSQAALGDTIEAETIHGMVKVKIPSGIQSGEKIRLKGKGIETEGEKGDHYLEIVVVTPEKLSRDEKKLFEELKDLE